MLDLLELKSCILDILKGNSNVNKNLEKFVNKSAKAAESRIKVLGVPKDQI